jgi:DNA polymerase-3 subunit gamma/tau
MYAPSGDDRYKVYIIDEAHMLSPQAWNALLKVLEEPPPRVVFVFATTEVKKVLATVLSRVQRFDLKRIGPAEIRERLAAVLTEEGIPFESDALGMIAGAADGGLRDALSLTDQVLALGETAEVTAERVRTALGLVPEEEYLLLLDIIAQRRAVDVFGAVQRQADGGVDLMLLLAGIGSILRAQLTVALGGVPPELSERMRLALHERKGQLSAGDLLRMLHALLELEPMYRRSGQPQLLLETLLVRFALLDRTVELEEVIKGFGTGGHDDPPVARGGG